MKANIKFINVNNRRIKLETVTSYDMYLDGGIYIITINLYNKDRVILQYDNPEKAKFILSEIDNLFKPIIIFENDIFSFEKFKSLIEKPF